MALKKVIMKKNQFLFFAFVCILFESLISLKLLGNSNIFHKYASVSLSEKYFQYEEPGFMESYGFMTGVDISLSAVSKNNFYAAGNLSVHYGKSDYNGGIQKAVGDKIVVTDYSTRGKNSSLLTYLDTKFGYNFELSSHLGLIPYLGLSFREYNLKIAKDGTKLPHEDERLTRNGFGAFGLIFNFLARKSFNLSAETSLGISFSPSVSYKNFCYGNTDNCKNFDLENGLYFSASSKAMYLVTDRLSLLANLIYKYYKFGESEKNLMIFTQDGKVLLVREPRSVNYDISLGIGLAYHFR